MRGMSRLKAALATVAVSAIAVAAIIITPTASAADPLVVEAEAMSWSGQYSNIADGNASGGHAVSMNSGYGSATGSTGVIESVTVRARGADCFGQAVMRTSLDGVPLGDRTVTGSYADYRFTVSRPAGVHTLQVQMMNPAWWFCTRMLVADKSTLTIGTPPTTTTTTSTTTTTTPTTTTTTTTPTTTTTTTPPGSPCPTTAATQLNWGTPVRSEDFNVKPSSATGWDVYNGPGHNNNGRRTPDAVSANGGIMTIIGSANGDSGGMAWTNARSLQGRWEVCMKTAAGSVNYHPVMLLWASSGGGVQATNGEVDFTEIVGSASRQRVSFFLHWNHPPLGTGRSNGAVDIDATAWHAWAVEWTSTGIVGYVDGREWFRDSNPDHFPTVAAGMTLQLDNFANEGDISQGGRMDFDWARTFSVQN